MLAFGFLLGVSAAARVASLNLCTDEYLLLLGRPAQIVSVSYLSQDRLESPLWQAARHYWGNRGSVEDVLTLRPTLILTMGGGGRSTALLASRLHIRSLDIPYANSLDDVAQNLRAVAAALGNSEAAEPWIARLRKLRSTSPSAARDSIWVSGHGDSLPTGSLGAQWLRLAGLEQRALPGGRENLETLLTNPPKVLVLSNYRSSQMSSGQRWLDNPIVRDAPSKRIDTDGRRWTCEGPLMIDEIERLRKLNR